MSVHGCSVTTYMALTLSAKNDRLIESLEFAVKAVAS